jgi:hypothetical protein
MPATHVYRHPQGKGYGQHHAESAGREHPAEMRDLDMPSGTQVEHAGTDEDTGALIVSWTDRTGIGRRTAVDPGFFTAHFTPVAPDAPEGN